MRIVRRMAEPLDATAFTPFGWLPVPDTDPADGEHTLTFEWGDPHLNTIGHRPDEVDRTEAGVLCTRLYRHESHTQVLMPLDVDAVVAVAPASVDLTAPGDLDAIRAFVVHPLDCFVLHPGTWHWGPFPLGREPVRLLNVQGRGYLADNASVDLEEVADAAIEVVVP